MDYKVHYDRLIERGRTRLLEGYSEQHHIVPRCMGGSNDTKNLVRLTAEEHYIAHQLLVKIYPKNKKLIKAATMMTISSNGQRTNNKLYGWLRKKLSDSMKGKTWVELYGAEKAAEMSATRVKYLTGRTHSKETCLKRSQALKGRKTGPQSEEHKRKNSESNMGRKDSAETRAKKSAARAGRVPWNKGLTGVQTHSQATKDKLSKARSGKSWPAARRATENLKQGH